MVLKLDYPVRELDGSLLYPAGTLLAVGDLRGRVASGRGESRRIPILQFGTVREDILRFMDESPGNTVFSNPGDVAEILELMAQVQFAEPILESVRYFQQNDPYTYRHILMVFAFSTLLSRDLVPDYRSRIREASTGPLHDFGKICVPLEILRKNTPLTREERRNLEHHTLAGYILLSHYSRDVESLAARVAWSHHEKRNGTGYPRGVHLNDRMVEIVAVCDIYDALTSRRPYRPVSFDNRSALEEITKMAERDEVSWEVVQALVGHNRKGKPHFSQCVVSLDRRGVVPPDNLYGVFAGESAPESAP
jgi:HD-GYP domain-containing protein (c-di-GMP phosphodiesterase class II)